VPNLNGTLKDIIPATKQNKTLSGTNLNHPPYEECKQYIENEFEDSDVEAKEISKKATKN
jgi:hypothetical protein